MKEREREREREGGSEGGTDFDPRSSTLEEASREERRRSLPN